MIVMRHLVSACFLAAALLPGAAKAEAVAPPTIEQMRMRDRHNKPSVELDAWQAFTSRVTADPNSSGIVRAEAHMRLARALYQVDEPAKGIAEIQLAEKAVVDGKLTSAPFLPELYATRAMLLGELKRFAEAQIAAEKSLSQARAQFGEASEAGAIAFESLSLVSYGKGDMAAARQQACHAADLAEQHVAPSNSLVAGTMMTCGIFAYNLDDDNAWQIMRRAANIAYANLPRDNTTVAQSLNGSGAAMLQLGRYAEAEAIFQRELELERALYGEDSLNAYFPLPVLGRTLEAEGKLDESEAIFRAAVDLIHRIDVGGGLDLRGNSLVNLASVLELRGRYDESADLLGRALVELKAGLPADHKSVAIAEQALSRLMGLQGHYDAALPLAVQSAPNLAKALGDQHRTVLAAQLDQAILLDHLGRYDAAYKLASDAAAVLEDRQLGLATKRADMVSLSQILTRGFSDFAVIALHNGKTAEAVRAAQLATLSELTLVNAELGARALARSQGLGPLIDQLRANHVKQRALQTELARVEAGAKGDPLTLGEQIKAADGKTARLTAEITARFPDFVRLGRPNPVPLADIQARLSPQQALIIPLNLPDRVASVAITAKSVFWGEAKGSNQDVIAKTAQIRRSIDDAQAAPNPAKAGFDGQAALALYRALLPDDLGSKIAAQSEWLFPSSGLASGIPPTLLLTKAPKAHSPLSAWPWLVRDHSVAIVSDFALTPNRAMRANAIRFAGIGDPVLAAPSKGSIDYAALFRGGSATVETIRQLPSLEGANRELRAMAAAFPQRTATLLTQAAANESAVKGFDFAAYAVIAFATHGLTSGEVNGLSEPALVLTPPEQARGDDDGLLTASEISTLDIPADWVILSACNTGSGRNASAPAYSGLARAFRLAGAHGFLLSHWPVRDDAATRLTVETVAGSTKGLSRAQALRRAILRLMADRSIKGGGHPAVWAPFILIEN